MLEHLQNLMPTKPAWQMFFLKTTGSENPEAKKSTNHGFQL